MRTREPRAHVQAPDRVDPARVRDDRDLRPVAGLARDALDLDKPVRDLRHLELEQRPDRLGERRDTMIDGPFAWFETSVMIALIRWPRS